MIDLDTTNIKQFLDELGFALKSGEKSTYFKKYQKIKYQLEILYDEIDFPKSKIDYGTKIKVSRGTTTNFSQQENFVILECVNRLLDKGYAPESICLEKNWKLGHKEKGHLDIFITDEKNEPFLMIECKTWEKEFRKEKEKMLFDNGGQLFSYYTQEKKTKYLCLYTSLFENDKIIYDNIIIKITDQIKKSDSQKEAYENWKPQIYENRGIFDGDVKPYLVKFSGLRKKDLKPLTEEDGGDIFNRFAEILRRNVVSDKTNAYNKIFNLFLCKIVDEYENIEEDKKMKFQWEEGEENETVMLRLNELYKKGMKQYLDLRISSVEIDELENQLKNMRSDKDKEKIKDLFIQQKLYTSNEFAFKEVFDKHTFDLNCIVVKEVVKLLEAYKIRYETKQQFLGDFFEKLLNTGIKQEVGQFFTPVPIAQFICKSLPIFEIIKEKNNVESTHFLPYCVDYSSGSGHFLTEIMAEINYYIENEIKDGFIKNGRAKQEYESQKNNYSWAKEYIYGIEKDYRLAKTTKIATFLNGDGDATVICGDGLDNFHKSKDYKNRLLLDENNKENENFDIVVANPPYSVSGFTTTMQNGKESFDLFENFTNKSNEIECLFIERTKQLLRMGGVAGIILPTNILDISGIYKKTREFLLENFEIKGIVKLGKNTFMATKTSTIILFIKKVKNIKNEITAFLEKSIKEEKDCAINSIETPIHKYLSHTYQIDIKRYFQLLKNNNLSFAELQKVKVFKKYAEEFKVNKETPSLSEYITMKEMDKLLYFILTYKKEMILYMLPFNNLKEEKKILGYEFSNRKGYEGIYIFNQGGKLYNPKLTEDKEKINYYVLKSFTENGVKIENEIKNLHKVSLHELIDFDSSECEKTIGLNKFEKYEDNTKGNAHKAILKLAQAKVIEEGKKIIAQVKKTDIEYISIKQILKIPSETGGTPPTRVQKYWKEGNIAWLKITDMKEKYVTETEKKVTEEGRKYKNLTIFNEGTVLFSIFGSIGKIAILKIKSTLNQAICALTPDEKICLPEYLYYILLIERKNISGKKTNRTQDNINKTKLDEYEIPLIKDPREQQKFVDKIKKIEDDFVKMALA